MTKEEAIMIARSQAQKAYDNTPTMILEREMFRQMLADGHMQKGEALEKADKAEQRALSYECRIKQLGEVIADLEDEDEAERVAHLKETIEVLREQIKCLEVQTACPDCGCATPDDAESKECGCNSPVCHVPVPETLASAYHHASEEFAAARLALKEAEKKIATAKREGAEEMRERTAEYFEKHLGILVGKRASTEIRSLPLEPEKGK